MINNAAENRFEVRLGESVPIIEYMRAGNNIIFTHTEVPKAFEGQGIANQMAHTALEFA
ncbi:MAG: GNAT family N-acetyltransferase, partial [Chloroflexota bacterium]